MSDEVKTRKGYRVIGNNTSDGALSSWYFPSLKQANMFAKQLCEETGREVDICKYMGSWKIVIPTEFIKSED